VYVAVITWLPAASVATAHDACPVIALTGTVAQVGIVVPLSAKAKLPESGTKPKTVLVTGVTDAVNVTEALTFDGLLLPIALDTVVIVEFPSTGNVGEALGPYTLSVA
jgi:hypothetical protein